MGSGGFFPVNPDLVDILGRTDFHSENFYFFVFFGFQISRFPGSKLGMGQAWALPGWAALGPGRALGRARPGGP